MDYKEKYEQGLECIQEILSGAGDTIRTSILQKRLQPFFPELKESEDERIRKFCISHFKACINVIKDNDEYKEYLSNKVIAWLGKQGKKIEAIENFDTEFEKQVSCLIASAINMEHEYNQGYVKWAANALLEYAKHELEKQGNKSVNIDVESMISSKVEPKFKEGDWIVQEYIGTYKIIEICESWYEVIDNQNNRYSIGFDKEHMCHLWSINDAKDGDVLVDEDNNIGLYLDKNDLYWHSCIYLGCDNCLRGFSIGGSHKHKNTKPATKEQRDLLFQKVKEAGYEWDSEKKELKKIEPNKLDSENVIEWIEEHVPTKFEAVQNYVENIRK